MDVRIRPAKTAKECDLIGEMHHAACRDLTWTRHVDPKVDPNEAKRFQSSLAAAIRKQYHGIVLVAEKEGKMMGYLTAWQYGKGSLDPYKHKEVYPSMKGRHLPIWWSVHSQVNEVCTKIEAEMGSFLCKSSELSHFATLIIDLLPNLFNIDIDKVVVSPGSQKQGVGRKLMRYTMKAAAEAYNMPIGLLAAPGKPRSSATRSHISLIILA
jgi:predicted GNAT family acetyltransferase